MQNLKQWVKDNQDLIALGALVTVCAAATTAIVIVTKNSVATQNRLASPAIPRSNPLPGPFQKHDYAGLLSIGEQGDLWAHPDTSANATPFKVGQADFENRVMYYSEYQYDKFPPADVIAAMPKINLVPDIQEVGLAAANASLAGAADPVTGAVSDAAMETARLAANEAMAKASK